jgi:hypothetical protein
MIHAINTAYKSAQHDFLIKTLTPLRLFGTNAAQISILSPLTLSGQVVQSKPKSPSARLSEIRVQLIRRANKKKSHSKHELDDRETNFLLTNYLWESSQGSISATSNFEEMSESNSRNSRGSINVSSNEEVQPLIQKILMTL